MTIGVSGHVAQGEGDAMTYRVSSTGDDSVPQGGGLRRQRFLSAALAVLMMAAPLAVTTLVTSSANAAGTEVVYSFGDNTDGALGIGTTTDADVPTVATLPGGVTPTEVAGGGDHSLAIASNGLLFAWGLNTNGQLGNGTLTTSSTPVQVLLPPGVVPVAIAAGDDHSLALGSNGTLYAWGYNGFGQLGNGTKANAISPVAVTTFPAGVTVTAISAGENDSLALGSDGNVYAWGDGNLGALGQGDQKASSTPLEVPLPSGVMASAIAAGGRFGMAIGSDGNLYSWGDGDMGELGNGTLTLSLHPVVVEMPTGVTASVISAGDDHALAIGSNDLLYSWGLNTDGQLGNGSVNDKKVPTLVSMPTGVTAVAIAGGLEHSLAIGSDGNLYAWGEDGAGELGNGGTTNSLTPVQASLPASAHPPTAVFAGAAADRGFAIAPLAPTPTSITLGSSASSMYYGQALTLTASVSPTDGGGTVSFLNGTSPVPGCSSLALTMVGSSYQALCSIPSLTPGSDNFSAKYGGDAGYVSSSTTTPFAVNVAQSPLVVTASSASSIYGSTSPSVTATYSGFVNGDSTSSLTSGATCSTTATSASPVSSYATSCSGATDPNYAITYDNGTLTVAPAPLSVTASSGTMTYGGSPPTITPSYSGFVSNDSASSLTTPATCSTAASSASSVGTYSTSCNGAVDSNYTVNYVNGNMVVGATPLVISASSASMTYGASPPSVTPSYEGFENGDNASSLGTAPTCSTTVSPTSPVGHYDTSCSGAVDPNYSINYVNGTDVVDPAPITITASSDMAVYGSAPPAVAPIVSGLQNGEGSSVLGSALTCTTDAVNSSPVGSYATQCSGAENPNYAVSYVNGTTTITPAPLSITASSGTMTYGGAVPAITPSISGLQNGDNPSVLGAGLTCRTTATSSSSVGSYPSTCAGAADNNYDISSVDGSVTMTPASLSITASSGTMTYGGAVPTITAIVTGLQNGDDPSVLGVGLACDTAADSSSPAGDYATACSGAMDANYTLTYAFGHVTVDPAILQVTASSASVPYGVNPPAPTASYSGFVNGDDASSLTTQPTCSTTATSVSPVRSYPSSCSGAVDPNYTFDYSNGTVQVVAALVVVTASSASMTYGGAVPAIAPSYSGFVNGDTESSLSTPPTCATAATSSSPVGPYASSCSGASDPNYSFSYVNGSVQVDAAPLSIAASSPSVTYGSAPPTITPSYSGFVNGDSASSLTASATCSTTATSSSPVGSYPSSCAGAADPNYTISYVGGEVVVGSAVLVVSASSDTMTYGGAVPTVTPSYAGFVNGDSASSLTAAATCSTTATSSSPVGSYPSSCTGAVDPNYTISFVGGETTIGLAPLMVTASSAATTYGGAAPTITASYSGFVNGDNAGSLTTPPTCATAAELSSPVGSYPSSCTDAVDPNYAITYFGGTVDVSPASLTITASSPSATYGSAVPGVTASYSGFVNGDGGSSLSTAPACSTTATSGSPAGSYPTLCSGAVDPNYSISYQGGTATVEAATLVVTASSASLTYGGAAPTITASYSGFVNGDDVSSLTTPPTCSTPVTSVTAVGSYSSSCTGAVDPNYSFSYVNGSVEVDPVPLTITAPSETMLYGSAVPALSASYSGFVDGDGASTLTSPPTCSTTVTSASPVGSYAVVCSGAVDSNYEISYVDGSMQVTAAALVVTASSGSMTYGGSAPVITANYSGFVNNDSATALTTQPTCSTTATSSSPVGTYQSSCSGAADGNYTITYVVGEIGVAAAPLMVTASSPTITYGGHVPAITASYSGLVNGDNASSLSTPPSCSTTATSSSPVGTYASACSGAADPSYVITYVDGSVAVGTAPLVVTAASGSTTYGGTVPTITSSDSGFVNGDTASSLTTQPTCSTTATPLSVVGTYPSSCSGAADPNYAVSYVNGVVAVGAATLVITASSGSMTYGGSVPSVGASYAGFENGDSASSLTKLPTCTTTATSSSAVGMYTTSCSGAVDPNYTIVYVAGAVQVSSANLTITASSASMTYGGSVPAVTASYSGFVNGDSASSLTIKPTCSTTVTSSSQVGSYATSCSGSVDANYDITYVAGTVAIHPANLTVTASSATVTYGNAAPAITASYSGFVNGDTATSLTTKPACTTAVTAASTVGSYASTCSGAADDNYTINYVSGAVTVTPALLTVTANNQTKALGAAVPALTATITGFVDGQALATSGVTGQATCSTTATTSSPAGSYPITCSVGTLAAKNYTFSLVAGTLTVTGSTTVCNHVGSLVVTNGESVLIPAGCSQVGTVTVQAGGSLEAQGAKITGAVSFNSGVTLLVCSTNLTGSLTAGSAKQPLIIGNGTSSCHGSNLTGAVSLTSNTAGVTVEQASAVGSVTMNSNSGGVSLLASSVTGQVAVEKNSGGATVDSNSIVGSLNVTGNTGTVVDRPNTVVGSTTLQ
ncbi:MAG TPA: MBG domain-containing protein [Acidimicrobiales bacterium]|nr:MBG domain-containing protein [Acidimicrobiales bacterium]